MNRASLEDSLRDCNQAIRPGRFKRAGREAATYLMLISPVRKRERRATHEIRGFSIVLPHLEAPGVCFFEPSQPIAVSQRLPPLEGRRLLVDVVPDVPQIRFRFTDKAWIGDLNEDVGVAMGKTGGAYVESFAQ